MNSPMQWRMPMLNPRCRYLLGGRRYGLVMTAFGFQVTVHPTPPRLLRWRDWRFLPQPDAVSAEDAFWRVVTSTAMAPRPHVRWTVIGDARMTIIRDEKLNYHVVVSWRGRPRARECGKSRRRALETGAEVAGELLYEQPRRLRYRRRPMVPAGTRPQVAASTSCGAVSPPIRRVIRRAPAPLASPARLRLAARAGVA